MQMKRGFPNSACPPGTLNDAGGNLTRNQAAGSSDALGNLHSMEDGRPARRFSVKSSSGRVSRLSPKPTIFQRVSSEPGPHRVPQNVVNLIVNALFLTESPVK